METSYLEAHPFEKRYPEWMPNLPSGHYDSLQVYVIVSL